MLIVFLYYLFIPLSLSLSLIRKSRGNKHTITTSKEEINNSHIENPINDEVALDTILDF